jgi:hypothetical protein
MMPMREQRNVPITPLDVHDPVVGFGVRVVHCADCEPASVVVPPSFGSVLTRGDKSCARFAMPQSRLVPLAYGTCCQREAHTARVIGIPTRLTQADEDNARSQQEFGARSRQQQLAEYEPRLYEGFGVYTTAPAPPLD